MADDNGAKGPAAGGERPLLERAGLAGPITLQTGETEATPPRPDDRVGTTNARSAPGAGPGAGGRSGQPGLTPRGPRRGPRVLGQGARALIVTAGLVGLWQGLVMATGVPGYLLPAPADVVDVAVAQAPRLARETAVTLTEIALGLVSGVALGLVTGLAVAVSPLAGRLVMPLLVASQALPVFALAPLLVIWLGFGLASKIVMTALVIYFPVASALADGLARTDPGLLDLARLAGAGRLRTLALIRFPAALPAFVTGIRVAAVFAPIGAVIGEWVGASAGLGLLMVQANARMQTDLLFAALAILAAVALLLQAVIHGLTARLIPWAETRDGGRLD